MKLTSSQRWAIGAVGLAVLIACSPKTPDPANEPAQPSPQPPSLSSAAGADAAVNAKVAAPGFAGEWALAEQDCEEPARTFKLSADKIVMSPGERSCDVKSISEEHPTGRSAVFKVTAACLAEGEASEDLFTLNFGAADTVMQLQLNGQGPARLVRCP